MILIFSVCSHWEKYNTGVMYLPWAYDVSMVGGTIVYALTAIFGFEVWKVKLPGDHSVGPLLEFFLYFGSLGVAVPVCLRNIYRSYRDKTGKMRTPNEALRPMVSFSIAMVLCLSWAIFSGNDILIADTRMFFYVSGTIFANLACRLIVSQMSDTRCELFNTMLWPLAASVFTSLLIPGFPLAGELALLYILFVLFTVMHLHYGVCVILQMCDHLKIEPFRIKYRGDARLLSDHHADDSSSNRSDQDPESDDEVIDGNELEVLVTKNASISGSVAPSASNANTNQHSSRALQV